MRGEESVDSGWFSARPGRPPKRSTVSSTPDTLDNIKKSRGIINAMSSTDYFSPVNHIIGMSVNDALSRPNI